MDQYMRKTQGDYGLGVTRHTINQDTQFELKGKFLKELHDNTFSGSKHEDADEHIKNVLEIVDLFHILKITQDQIMLLAFPVSLTGAASRWLRNQPSGLITTWEVLKTKFLNKYCPPTRTAKKMKEINNFQQEPDESLFRAWERFRKLLMKLVSIQTQLNNLGREIKKVNEKVYVAHVECELCNGRHYTKDCPQKEEGKTLKEAYYTQFDAPYQPGGQYRAVGPGFYQQNNGNSSYLDRRRSMEESLSKFMAELAKRYEENSDIIKEIRASTDAAIRNQGALFKTLEIQIEHMSKVFQERGFGTLTIKQPRGIAKNVLVRIGKFVFPIDFIILDIPEDDDVPLILRQPFLSTAHSKIDFFKRKINLTVGEENRLLA
nr:hypothetical protein [Tanacetum cinerariifolium]